MANVLTGIRIICGLLILAFPSFSKAFYVLYLLGGFTDAIDGTVARKLGKESEFGSKFDTLADLIFISAVVVKLISSLIFPLWLILWICAIAAVKLVNIAVGYIKQKQFVTVHSGLNRICGVVVFITPLFLGQSFAWQAKLIALCFACIIASLAAIKECFKITDAQKEQLRSMKR